MPDNITLTRVLLVCANPRGTNPLRTAQEDRTLRESVHFSPHGSKIEVETLNAATIDDLRRALLKSHFDIVHFSGHGTERGLVFEDTGGRLIVPSSEALAELLSRHQVSTAILNACYSLSVGRFTNVGLEFTVASAGPVADPAAIEFTRGFYDAVGAGKDIPDAYEEGLSCARLKGYAAHVVLLRRGESYKGEDRVPEDVHATRSIGMGHNVLVGIALDTSGSMQDSIRNESGGALTRLESARQAIEKIGRSVQSSLQRRASGAELDAFHLFAYAFGLRIGGVGDLFSLVRASRQIDLQSEIANRRRKYEAEARQSASGYGGLADLARGFGLGDVVNRVTDAARSQAEQSIRERIVGEIAGLLRRKAEEIGDSTLTADEVVQIWEDGGRTTLDDVEPLIYGSTPMTAAAAAIAARFERTKGSLGGNPESMLLVVSDGEPTDGDPRPEFEAIRGSGIVVVSCFVTDDNLADPRVLVGMPQSSWSSGARLMFDIASPIDETGPFARYLLGQGWAIERGARLFVQVNHSTVLEEFVRMIGTQLSDAGVELLPEGR